MLIFRWRVMQVYLAKPGGKKEGPFTIDQVRQDLAAKKYDDADFWAWHDGLTEWLPLYALPALSVKPSSTSSASTAVALPAESDTDAMDSGETFATASGPEKATPSFEVSTTADSPVKIADHPRVFSGRPINALAQVFILTTGNGPAVFKSEVITGMLEQTVSVATDEIRRLVAVDVIGNASINAMESLCAGTVPESVWRALHRINPVTAQTAQEGGFHLCLRTFPAESQDIVAILALYRK